MNITPFHQRRLSLLQHMQAGLAVIPTAPEQVRNRDTTYPYRA
ncbi:MAG: aminopeptidase P N-terminal domain-containing protein, partial [Rhodocyclaceae bacterium]|nr:aminopeptidase P N-terminal domain-containing protein [Rhodocyclaceae bacterium]